MTLSGHLYDQKCEILIDISLILSKKEEKVKISAILRDALQYAKQIKSILPKTQIFAKLSTEIRKIGDVNTAKILINEAIGISKFINPHSQGNDLAIRTIAIELFKQKKLNESLEISKRISNETYQVEFFSKIIEHTANPEEKNIIFKKIAEIEKIIRMPKNYLFIEIFCRLIEYEKLEEACIIFEKINEQDKINLNSIYLAKAYNNIGDTNRAFEYINNFSLFLNNNKSKFSTDICLSIANEFAKLGLIKKAINELKGNLKIFKEKINSNEILKEICLALSKDEKYTEILIISKYIENKRTEIEVLLLIANNLYNYGNKIKAKIFLDHGIKILNSYYDYDRDYIMKIICEELIQQKDVYNAIKIIKKSNNQFFKNEVYKTALKGLLLKGKIAKAKKLAEKIKEKHWNINFLIELSNKYNEINQVKNSESAIYKAINLSLKLKDEDEINFLLREISIALANQLKFEKSFEIAEKISFEDEYNKTIEIIYLTMVEKTSEIIFFDKIQQIDDPFFKIELFRKISIKHHNKGNLIQANLFLNEAKSFLLNFKDLNQSDIKFLKIKALLKLSTELAIRGSESESKILIERSLQIYSKIWEINLRDMINKIFAVEFCKQNKFQDSIEHLKKIEDLTYRIETSKFLSSILIKSKDSKNMDAAFNFISMNGEKIEKWKKIGKSYKGIVGKNHALNVKNYLKSDDACFYYLGGWADSLDVAEVDQDLIEEALSYFIYNTDSIEILLQKYALHETFLGNSSPEQLQRLNRTLNIQWALDIAASFPKDEENANFSLN